MKTSVKIIKSNNVKNEKTYLINNSLPQLRSSLEEKYSKTNQVFNDITKSKLVKLLKIPHAISLASINPVRYFQEGNIKCTGNLKKYKSCACNSVFI